MKPEATTRFGPKVFVLSLAGLGLLPILPEIALFFQTHSDLKGYKTIWYFEFIVSFLLLVPALLLPRLFSRLWVILFTLILCPVTLIVGFYSAANGTRWNLTAHTALFETNRPEALGYLRTFATFDRLIWIGLLAAAFGVCLIANIRSRAPSRRVRWLLAAGGFVVCFYGIRLEVLYAKHPFAVTTSEKIRTFPTGNISAHPLLLFAAIHYNYVASRRYYLSHYRQAEAHFRELEGAKVLPGTVGPRVGVVVVGESANRLHWGLYGYPKDTTPGMREISGQLFTFTDVVSGTVGTVTSIRGMMTTPGDAIPVFHLFTGAGYTTHWLSTRSDSGDETQLAAMVESCDDRIYLSGAYDESLVPFLARITALPGKQLIFLNLTGSHVRYSDDYPASQAVFHGSGATAEFVATYDNSIHYTDYVLSQIVRTLKARNDSSFMLYFSDHGEDVYDSRPDKYLFRDQSLATDPMYEVPFLVWFSPQYAAENREFVSNDVAGAVHRPFQNVELYHSLLSLLRLTHPLYDATKDLFSPEFVARERRVGVPGRIYHEQGDRGSGKF